MKKYYWKIADEYFGTRKAPIYIFFSQKKINSSIFSNGPPDDINPGSPSMCLNDFNFSLETQESKESILVLKGVQ